MNDMYLLPTYGLVLIGLITIYICMLVWHELGHMLYFKYKRKTEIMGYLEYKNIF